MIASANAQLTVGLVNAGLGQEANNIFRWDQVLDESLAVDISQNEPYLFNVDVNSANGVPDFSFTLTVTSLTNDPLIFYSGNNGYFLAVGTEVNDLIQTVGQGMSFEVSGITDSSVQFDGFESMNIGGNGGGDLTTITSGSNSIGPTGAGTISLSTGDFVNGTSLELDTLGNSGIRLGKLNLQFSAVAVPEPGTYALLMSGLALSLVFVLRRRRH